MTQIDKQIFRLDQSPELIGLAASWFSEKWDIPADEYEKSMTSSSISQDKIPQWYIVIDDTKIIAGAGVIENDFHDRLDLSPNICALYVEKAYRNQHVAKVLLHCIQNDFSDMGINKLYLITDHIDFYEKIGWSFKTLVKENDGNDIRLYENTIRQN